MTDPITGMASATTPKNHQKAARDLDARELRDIIQEGVFRGVLKAVAVYALISLLIWRTVIDHGVRLPLDRSQLVTYYVLLGLVSMLTGVWEAPYTAEAIRLGRISPDLLRPGLGDLWRLWKEGDRKAAAESIPDSVVDDLLVWGRPEQCKEHIARYIENGVTTPAPALFCGPDQISGVIRALAR